MVCYSSAIEESSRTDSLLTKGALMKLINGLQFAYPLGSDLSKYSIVSLIISSAMTAALAFAWRERLASTGQTVGHARPFFAIVGLWIASISAVGQLAFSIFRLSYPPHLGRHQGPVLAIALLGLLLSPLALLGMFATGFQRRIMVLSGTVMTIVWFLAALDSVNW